ncbi:hypothetical protein ACFL1G_02930 [Planctomycetota bacterium]
MKDEIGMSKKSKLLFTGIGILLLLTAILLLILHSNPYKPNPIRPVNFPEILVVPEEANDIDCSREKDGFYGVSFTINEPFPFEKTRDEIHKHLESFGWKRLKYHIMNPEVSADSDAFGFIKQPFRTTEDWLDQNDNSISLYYTSVKTNEDEIDMSKVHVIMHYRDRESYMKTWILKYKKLHPNEFLPNKDNSILP